MSEFPSLKGKGYDSFSSISGDVVYTNDTYFRESVVCECCIDKQELLKFLKRKLADTERKYKIANSDLYVGMVEAYRRMIEEFERRNL